MNKSNGGLDFIDALTLIFIILKLIGVIDWSWWRVLSPYLISAGLIMILKILGG